MQKNKTTENKSSVNAYISGIKEEPRRKDFSTLVRFITKCTGLPPKMWGTAIVGFGSYHYVYESGREGDAPLMGISSRANAMVLYLSAHFENREELLAKFGKHKTGKGCIYVQQLKDIDMDILAQMVERSIAHRKKENSGC